MDKRDKNFIIDDALNLVSSYLHSVTESELEKKGMKRKLQLLVWGALLTGLENCLEK